MRRAPRIYLVTDRKAVAGNGTLPEQIARALEAVAKKSHDGRPSPATTATAATVAPWAPHEVAVQLREKDLGGRELVALGLALRRVTRDAGVRLFVNDRVDLAIAVDADGVHLGGGSVSPEHVKTLAPRLAVSVATHSLAEVERAVARPDVEFVVFGPIFDTPSKRHFGLPPVGLAALADAAKTHIPVVAIGGIDARNAGECFRAGAAGIACIRAVLGADDPRRALADLWR